MSTIDQPSALMLLPGQRLDRHEFHARYLAMPPGTKAELVGGIVVMPSPVGRYHGINGGLVVAWLNFYHFRTPGTQVMDNATVVLDEIGEVQPDALMRILPSKGGQTRDLGKFIAGAPEFIVEIVDSSRDLDLGPKLAEYERAGALEYVVFALDPDEVFWHVRQGDRLVRVEPGVGGLFRSKFFPGLWLDPSALFDDNGLALIEALDRGLATAEHADFVAQLATR